MSLNPKKMEGIFTKKRLTCFAGKIFFEGLHKDSKNTDRILSSYKESSESS